MKATKTIALGLFLTLLAGAAWGGGSRATGSSATATTAGQKVINYTNGGSPPYLEPVMNNYLAGSYLMYNLFCGLGRIGKNGVAELGYAESYTVSTDGLVYTFKIRANSKFSDGSPLTARDWERSFKHRLDPNIASPGVDLYLFVKNAEAYNTGDSSVKADDVGIKALDDTTLQITLENPTPFFLDVVCYYVPYKMDILLANPEWHKRPETYISNGAFRVKAIDPQTGLVLEKNPYYFDAANNKIDIVNYNFIDDSAIALEAYRRGDLNVNDSVNAEGLISYRNTAELKSFPRIGTTYISIHTANVSDARVRKALSLAINRDVLIKSILQQPYVTAQGLVPYGIHWGSREFRDVAGNLIESNVEKAKALLVEAGHPNGQGLPTLRIITMNTTEDMDSAQAWQAMWKEIGINSEITTYESSVYWDMLDTNGWDLARDGWTGDYDDPRTNLFLWMGYREGPDKDVRWYNTPNALRFDELMRSADAELDKERRLNIFKEAEQVILDDMPVIPLWHGVENILIKPQVTGIVKSNIGHIYFQYADVN
jgi:oligopeptide transport system substrate-binding protein